MKVKSTIKKNAICVSNRIIKWLQYACTIIIFKNLGS